MNFQRLIEGECGGSSPLEQLASHTTQDIAFQEIMNRTSTTVHKESNQMPVQSFRMADLMQEINVIESERTVMPAVVNQFPAANWTPESREELENSASFLRTSPHYTSDYYNFGLPEQQAYYSNILNHPRLEQTTNEDVFELQEKKEESHEKCLRLQAEPGYEYVVINSLDLLKSNANQFEDVGVLEEAESVQRKGSSIKAEEIMNKFERIFSDPVKFNKLINTYLLECTPWGEKQHQISKTELSLTSEYPFIADNPMLNNSNAISEGFVSLANGDFSNAVLCLEAAIQNDPGNLLDWVWHILCKTLYRINNPYKLLCATKQLLKLRPYDPLVSVAVANSYQMNDCPYQACKSLFEWLRENKMYCDIIPPNFKMDDKETTELDVEVLNAVKYMFIKAAQRKPINPDSHVQHSLAVLCSLSEEHDKAVDCLRLVNMNTYKSIYRSEEFDLATNLFLANEPHKAIEILEKVAEKNYLHVEIDAYMKIGLIYMYLREYGNALKYLYKAQSLSSDDNLALADSCTLACEKLLSRQQNNWTY